MRKKNRAWTVLSMLEWATDYFNEKKVPDPRLSIEWILAEALGIKRLDLYLQFERPLSSKELDRIRPLVKRRAGHEPLQHITGSTDFLNAKIKVNRDVLIPRIETEQLVDLLLDDYSDENEKPLNLLDIGTGSGCIPVSIKKERSQWHCTGIDISDKAIKTARENAERNDVEVTFKKADILCLSEWQQREGRKWDIIISNPPYITPEEKPSLEKQVREHEPSLALFHKEPLQLYKKIVEFSYPFRAALYLECNEKTASEVKSIAKQFYDDVTLLKDLDGNDRFIICRNS
jgi:release factor glutamine methyltransferase